MPKFLCSYAYDVPHYADFTVEAKDISEAEQIVQTVLQNGYFYQVQGQPDDMHQNKRVLVYGHADDRTRPTMQQLIDENKQ